ncbi:carboxyl transferase domain-containing protein [Tritonibacter multivorans]|nr:carboxyl transferase domain-containing protein [Tritonibacter multivorans]
MKQLEARAATRSEARRALIDRCGRLTARARLSALLDAEHPYLPLYNMASYLVDGPDPLRALPGASLLGGIGFVAGVRCVVAVDDAGINAGVMTAKTAEKLAGLIRVAHRQGLPFVHLMDSVGPDLHKVDGTQWDALGTALAELARKGPPVVSVLHGSAIGAVSLFAGLSDHVIAVRKEALVMLAGAAQVRAVTGEVARDAALGGAELHSEVTGLVDQLADDDGEAIQQARAYLASRWSQESAPTTAEPPLAVASVAPEELAVQIADAGAVDPYKPGYGVGCQCMLARIGGHAVAILAAGDAMDPDALRKCCAFLDHAEQAGLPVLFLLNSNGFALGRQAERGGIVRLAAQLMARVVALRTPRIALRLGAAHGAAGFVLGGLSGALAGGVGGMDFMFSWPGSEAAVLPPQEAGRTLEQVALRSAQRRNLALDEKRLGAQRADLEAHLTHQAAALVRSGQGGDMGVIDPRDSRNVLRICLDTCAAAGKRRVNV